MAIAMLLALLATPVAGGVPANAPEIVVMGTRLDHWSGKYTIRGTQRKCSTKTSSGDPDIDSLGCEAFLLCADKYQTLTNAGDARGIDAETRANLKQSLIERMKACIADQRASLLADLADRRSKPAKPSSR